MPDIRWIYGDPTELIRKRADRLDINWGGDEHTDGVVTGEEPVPDNAAPTGPLATAA